MKDEILERSALQTMNTPQSGQERKKKVTQKQCLEKMATNRKKANSYEDKRKSFWTI